MTEVTIWTPRRAMIQVGDAITTLGTPALGAGAWVGWTPATGWGACWG